MILSKPFAIACSLASIAAPAAVVAAEETISLSAGFIEFNKFAERGEDGTWGGFLFDLADLLVDKAAADGVTLDIAIDTTNGVLSDSFTYNEALATLDPDCAGDACFDMIFADCKWSTSYMYVCMCDLCANIINYIHVSNIYIYIICVLTTNFTTCYPSFSLHIVIHGMSCQTITHLSDPSL